MIHAEIRAANDSITFIDRAYRKKKSEVCRLLDPAATAPPRETHRGVDKVRMQRIVPQTGEANLAHRASGGLDPGAQGIEEV